MNERFCPVDAAGFCPNYCKVMPCKLAKSPLELALDIYWNNHQPAIARSIDKLLDALKPQQPEPSYAFSPHDGKGDTLHTPRGREMTAADLGLWCDCLDVDCETCNPLNGPDILYSFWLGADG